jgi:FlaG/FlaF family flagellin (archaellin)
MMSGYRDAMTKRIHSKQAVSEVIGVVLLLGITISLFAVLNFYVFHFSFNPSVPSVDLIGTINKEDNKVIINIEHNGGESLEGTTEITITIGSNTYQRNTSDLLIDTNNDNKWNFGEIVQFGPVPITGSEYIRATVVDPKSNTMLLSVVLQQ